MDSKEFPVLSYLQIAPLLAARKQGQTTAELSTDLGRSSQAVFIDEEGVHLSERFLLDWEMIEEIHASKKVCFEVDASGVRPIREFSSTTNRQVSLLPTDSAPALMVAGFLMHRIRDTDPYTGAGLMVEALAPIRGELLDTATGLGYAAIQAASRALSVTTIELDPAVERIARKNPWSRPLFSEPKISRVSGDSYEKVLEFAEGRFAAVIHDPPTLGLGGELYSEEFYRRLFRIVTKNGKVFHYIGDPQSTSGARTTKGVIGRLKSAGFRSVKPAHDAHGVIAIK